jgi:energy-coupling factor transporter transmembrane protein EcfT
VPLLAGTIRRADEIATALHSRGFTVQAVPREPRATLAWHERAVVMAGWAMLALLAGATVLTRLHLAGVYSQPSLQGLYAWVVAYV